MTWAAVFGLSRSQLQPSRWSDASGSLVGMAGASVVVAAWCTDRDAPKRIMIYVACDLACHADIVLKQHDTAIGLQRESTNVATAMTAGVRHHADEAL
jgi:hypothetical protein